MTAENIIDATQGDIHLPGSPYGYNGLAVGAHVVWNKQFSDICLKGASLCMV